MNLPKLVVVGTGGHARSCIDVIEQDGSFSILGLIAELDATHSETHGYPTLGTDDILISLIETCQYAVIGIGQIKSSDLRVEIYKKLTQIGYQLPRIISPNAYVSHNAQIGKGTIVMHGAVVNAGAVIGQNCIINTRAVIEHDVIIGDNCHISTGAIINGSSKIGSGSFIGSGTVIMQGVSVGINSVIGMGQFLRKSIGDHFQTKVNYD